MELVAKLTKVDNLAQFIPLFLEGGALAVYLEMSAVDQAQSEAIQTKLKEAFSDSAFVAYSKLVNKKWTGESVDVFSNELRRLAGLSGLVGTSLEQVVKLSFVNGFPDSVSTEMQKIDGIATMSMSELLVKARILIVKTPSVGTAASVVVNKFSGSDNKREYTFKGKCFNCDGPHMVRSCPEKKTIKCYNCREEGHISTHCPKSGNDKGGSIAPVASSLKK